MKNNIVFSHIRKTSLKHLLISAVFLLLSSCLVYFQPYDDIFFRKEVSSSAEAVEAYEAGARFVVVNPEVIYYTGYDLMKDGKIKGAYYYELSSADSCVFYLMDEAGDMEEYSYKTSGILVKFDKANGLFDNMLEMLSSSIEWNYEDLKEITSDIILVQADNDIWIYYVVFAFVAILMLYLTVMGISNLIYAIFPILHPAIRKIKRFYNYKSYKTLSEDLDYQLVTEVANAGGMFITENYFIHLGALYVNIVPLSEIVFVYKNSQLRNFVGMHFIIKYTLHIRGNEKFKCMCPGKKKEDADFILDYFAENYPDIINGYTDRNRRKAIKLIRQMKQENKKMRKA